MKLPHVATVLLFLAVLAGPSQAQNWEPAIKAFEKRDAKVPPAENGVLFVGSSSIRFWNTDKDFPHLNVINRGFGGSQTSDVLDYMDRIVIPYKPRVIVLYVGDNDIAAGKTPDEVVTDTKTFIERVQAELPKSRIVYIAIKPSLARWNLIEPMRQANVQIEALADEIQNLDYVDVDAPMLGEDGKPRAELFVADGLHLSEAGYALWNDLVRPHVEDPAGE